MEYWILFLKSQVTVALRCEAEATRYDSEKTMNMKANRYENEISLSTNCTAGMLTISVFSGSILKMVWSYPSKLNFSKVSLPSV